MATGVSETVTAEELQENRLFINAIMETDVMKVSMQYYSPANTLHSSCFPPLVIPAYAEIIQ